jgi:hypothetical protein
VKKLKAYVARYMATQLLKEDMTKYLFETRSLKINVL